VNVGTSSSPSYVGYAGRRQIVSDDKCNACHQELGTFTEDAFHAGQRNDGTTCSWCHTPNRGSSAWTAETGNMTHAIHAGAKRNVPYTWHAISTTDYFGLINYPGILARCEQCHIAGSYDFANSASANAVGLGADGIDKRQFRTVGKGKYIGVAGNQVMTYKYDNVVGSLTFGTCIEDKLGTAQTATGVFSLAPASWTGMVYDASGVTGTYYGFDYTPNVRTGASTPSCSANGTVIPSVAAGTAVEASPLTLVVSPTTVACVGCHDSSLAISHMKLNGGAFYEARSTALGKVEQCFICHASGRLADVKAVHAR
jgi:OmcA/MtrC family decaheme c-type cytochrome